MLASGDELDHHPVTPRQLYSHRRADISLYLQVGIRVERREL